MSLSSQKTLDEVLRKMLNTPPEPHKVEIKAPKKKTAPKKKPA